MGSVNKNCTYIQHLGAGYSHSWQYCQYSQQYNTAIFRWLIYTLVRYIQDKTYTIKSIMQISCKVAKSIDTSILFRCNMFKTIHYPHSIVSKYQQIYNQIFNTRLRRYNYYKCVLMCSVTFSIPVCA